MDEADAPGVASEPPPCSTPSCDAPAWDISGHLDGPRYTTPPLCADHRLWHAEERQAGLSEGRRRLRRDQIAEAEYRRLQDAEEVAGAATATPEPPGRAPAPPAVADGPPARRRGRRKGSGRFWTDQQFRRRLAAELDKVPAKKHPTKKAIASQMGMSHDTLDAYLERCGIDWGEAKLSSLERRGLA